MLLKLKIQNLILIEEAEINFGPGLNILTGETGAGKSAVLSAIRLLAGERADHQLIRKGAKMAVVEALLSSIQPSFFEEEGIPIPTFPVLIRREIYASGKNRSFIDEAQVGLQSLKRCIGSAIERIDQSSSLDLCSQDEQRKYLDIYASLSSDLAEFSSLYTKTQEEAKKLQTFYELQKQRDRDLKIAEDDLEAIDSYSPMEGEEEKLTEEHHLLTHGQELIEKLGQVANGLSEVPYFKRQLVNLEQCVRLDPKLEPLTERFRSAILELDDVALTLSSYLDRIEMDPLRLEWLEKRIAGFELLKKRFGIPLQELKKKKKELQNQIEMLSNLEEEIETLKKHLNATAEKTELLSKAISEKRKKAAPLFADLIQEELKNLNIPNANFQIEIGPKPLSPNGSDEIRFLFSANTGIAPIPLENCASGGELSRSLLALKTVLSEKEQCPCLVLDEIDSNVGGQTAAILGEKLKKLSHSRQVICVTHFVQVARSALHHFLVAKEEQDEKTFTRISKLSPSGREDEYKRMLGGYR